MLWTPVRQKPKRVSMMIRRAFANCGCVLLLIASLAMSAAAFAHRVADPAPSPDLLAYLDIGGTLEDLCGDTGPSHLTSACDACRIMANALAPMGARPLHRPQNGRVSVWVRPIAQAMHAPHPPVSPPSRAPPAV
ncbi:hypothetical protein [Roseobacter sp.]|uniref:hypothetical protein n=1 Tax=Roseobacter sp. TaxID=1907202 RepID=UPI003297EFC9